MNKVCHENKVLKPPKILQAGPEVLACGGSEFKKGLDGHLKQKKGTHSRTAGIARHGQQAN
eukprot:9525462-Prorocentrum_lima.AAC.1